MHATRRALKVVVAERRYDLAIDFAGYAVKGPRKRKA
jgi:hypothetical protein